MTFEFEVRVDGSFVAGVSGPDRGIALMEAQHYYAQYLSDALATGELVEMYELRLLASAIGGRDAPSPSEKERS